MAISGKKLRAELGDAVSDHSIFVMAGDGCLMEGINHEAAAMAGHLRLDNLVVLFDDNAISIDGPVSMASSEDVLARFAAYGWDGATIDGHDVEAIDAAGADWNASAVEFRAGRAFFTPCYRGKAEERIEAAVIGRHNVNNALAVYALGRLMGIESATLHEGLRSFAGVKRRQEIRGESRGVVVIDDFAHHPTAVRETIEAVRAAYPRHTVWAVFEPRSNTSKRNIFEREFAEALALADKVLVAPVYQPEKIAAGERLTVENVVRAIDRLRGKGCARAVSGVPEIARRIGDEAQAGDVILVMSNGGFDNVHQKILQALAA